SIQQIQTDNEIIKKDLNDKEKQLSSNYEKIIQELKESYQNDQKETEQQKQSIHVNSLSSYTSSTPTVNFQPFRSSSKLINTIYAHTRIVNSIDCSTFDDDQFICSGSDDTTVRIWIVNINRQIRFNGHSDRVSCVKFSQYHYHYHRRNVICSSSRDKTIRFWHIKDNQQFQTFNGHTDH
ncbi:WD-40 repeat protein, partial [Reticulomyxa filosa]